MPDERDPNSAPRFEDEWENQPNDENSEVSASVAFMEMMRQAASKKPSNQPSAADELFARVAPPPPKPTIPTPAPGPTVTPTVAQAATSTAQPDVVTQTDTVASVETASSEQLVRERKKREAAIEEQRVLRIKRRRARRRQRTVGTLGGIVRSFMVVVVAAGLMATIFTWWTPSQFLNDDVKQELSAAQATGQVSIVPTSVPTPNWMRRVGIVSGHRGPQVPPDPGAVCPDGLTEASINFAVAQIVVRNLRSRGYSVDLLDEFDPRLENYQAAALVSIHSNTCQDWPGEIVSGYLIARAAARTTTGVDDLLVDCVGRYYAQSTGLSRRDGVTVDMSDYHTFREIHPLTPATIIELGFMLADRPVLTGKQEEMARGITDGIFCFLEPGELPPTATPGASS